MLVNPERRESTADAVLFFLNVT